jgi:uncharacterized phage protein (TIGR02216 family)
VDNRFTDAALKLCGQSAMLLGWRPGEFWSATPAELECVLTAMMPETQAPLDSSGIRNLMEQFPDG